MNRRILLFLALAIPFPTISQAEDDRRNASPNSGIARKTSPPRKITRPDSLEPEDSKDGKKPAAFFGPVSRTIFSLIVVLGLIFTTAWILKKNKIGFGASNAAEVLEVIGKRTVAPKQSIYLVRLGSRILVLGSGIDGLTSLSEITDPFEVDYLAGICKTSAQKTEKPLSFLSMFRRESHRKTPAIDSGLVSSVEIRDDTDEAENESQELSPHQYQQEETHA